MKKKLIEMAKKRYNLYVYIKLNVYYLFSTYPQMLAGADEWHSRTFFK